ncbi:hypothetical protein DV736_g2044, partial [Chaetothyriales sp. CBS 134916]
MSAPSICSSFILGSPPGELTEVINDIKTLTSDDEPGLINRLKPAIQKYNEEQLVCVKLPGASQHVVISSHNRLPDGRYYDTHSKTAFQFDHLTSTASHAQSYTHDSAAHSALITSLNAALSRHFAEHYPPSTSSGFLVCTSAVDDEATIAIILSTTKSSPSNFLSARWRSSFLYSPASKTLRGSIQISVHYYEDGNVALTTVKSVPDTALESAGAEAIVGKIAAIEKQYQEQVNRTFVSMNEQGFKALRRQLPVTRQKVEWEKATDAYRVRESVFGTSASSPQFPLALRESLKRLKTARSERGAGPGLVNWARRWLDSLLRDQDADLAIKTVVKAIICGLA